jgi:hypothetical protein
VSAETDLNVRLAFLYQRGLLDAIERPRTICIGGYRESCLYALGPERRGKKNGSQHEQ